jgi:hypothetical protein
VAVILDALLERLAADRLIAVAIPDYTVTPAGAEFGDPRQRHAAIVAANAVMAEQTRARGIGWVDIFDVSLRARDDRSLVASDGLHPSGAQYSLWVERIAPVVKAARALISSSAGRRRRRGTGAGRSSVDRTRQRSSAHHRVGSACSSSPARTTPGIEALRLAR